MDRRSLVRASALALVLACAPREAGAAGHGGTYATAPPVSYTCAFGLFATSWSSLAVVDNPPTFSVSTPGSAEPGTVAGTLSEPSFTAQKVEPGGCTVTQTIAGTFPSANGIQGTYTIQFTGAGCAGTGCTNQSFPFTGARPAPAPLLSPLVLAGLAGALALLALGYRRR